MGVCKPGLLRSEGGECSGFLQQVREFLSLTENLDTGSVEVREATGHTARHRTALDGKNDAVQNVRGPSSAAHFHQ